MSNELTHEERKKVALFLEVGHDLDDVLELHPNREFFVVGYYIPDNESMGIDNVFWSRREAHREIPGLGEKDYSTAGGMARLGFYAKFSDFLSRTVPPGFEMVPRPLHEHELIGNRLEKNVIDPYFDGCEKYEILSGLYYDLLDENKGREFPSMGLVSNVLDGLKHDVMYARRKNKIPESVFRMEDTVLGALARAEEYYYNTRDWK